jgi:hypothetical protein
MKRLPIAAMLLVYLVALSTTLTAQQSAQRYRPRYKHIDIGTFGGPISYGSPNGVGSRLLNNAGVVASSADTTAEMDQEKISAELPWCSTLFLNPHLMERPDRWDPAIEFVEVRGRVFRGLLKQRGCVCGCRSACPALF